MLLILGLTVLGLLLSGTRRRLTLWLALAAAAVAALALWRSGLRWEMAPAYLLTAVQLALAALRRVRPTREAGRLGRARRATRWTARIVGAPLGLFLLAYPVMVTPMLSSGYRHDLQHLGWTEAFERMHEELAAEYPFTEWKGIDWAGQYALYHPLITASEAASDLGSYHLALRRYVYDIADGHMRVTDPDDVWREQHVGGSFGLALGQLDDGTVIVTQVWEAAARAGVNWGDEVTLWNGTPVEEALARTPTIWADRPPATREVQRLQELRFLVRAPVGSVAQVTIRPSANGASARPDEGAVGSAGNGPPDGTAESAPDSTIRTVRLVAQRDDGATLTFTERLPQPPPTSQTFESVLLPGGYGYLRLTAQRFPSDTGDQVRRAVREFQAAGVRGIVVDLRGNRGGSDFTVPRVVAPFFSVPDLYHHVSTHNPKTGRFEPIPFNTFDPVIPYISYRVTPSADPYAGPVAVLVDQTTASSAEGIAMLLARLPNSEVVGFHGTRGILGAGNYKNWLLPGDLRVRMLDGRSLDAQGNIQVDADARGEGGVPPTLRVPRNAETMRATFLEHRDVPLEHALRWIDGTDGGGDTTGSR